MDDDRYQALRASMLCVELSDDQCRTLAGVAELRDLAEGAVLVHEGTADSHLYLVMRGVLGVVKNADTPEGRTLHTLSSGDFADELGFLDGTPYYASKVALNETRVVSLDRAALESLLDADPQLVYRIMRAIVRVTHSTQRRLFMQQNELSNYVYKQHGRY